MSTTVAVTGATGFLGQHLTGALLGAGYTVRGLARDPGKALKIDERVERRVVGDINQQAALDELVAGADVVIHLVSNFRTASGPPESYRSINLEGTRAALNAAQRAGVRRFVYCSTIGVHGHVDSTPADEDTAYNPGDLYQTTKMHAERLCLLEAERGSMEIVVVRPCSQYGPGDLRMLKLFRMLEKRTFPTFGACRENFHAVYIDDVVDGILRVITTPGINGQAFILGGPDYQPLWEYISAAARAVGARPPFLRLPYWPFYAASVVCEAVCVPLRLEPPLHPRRLRFFRNNRAFSLDKAREVLGYQPRVSLEEGLARTVAWYRENGYLSPDPSSPADTKAAADATTQRRTP